MEEYYIRAPGHDESRGPFGLVKLPTLVEADQLNKNSLNCDNEKSKWIPIGLTEELNQALFPEKKNLSLKARSEPIAATENDFFQESALGVVEVLAAAKTDAEETRYLKKQQKSFERAISISSMSLALMMLLSAVVLGAPFLESAIAVTGGADIATLLNSPFFLVASIDCIFAIALMLAVTDIFPLVRFRAMLSLGFGTYLGRSIGDPIVMLGFLLGSCGMFYATMARNLTHMLGAVLVGIGGYACLAYFAITGRLAGFFETIQFDLVP